MQSDENAYPECKSMWQKNGNQTVTPFSFYIYFLEATLIMCKVRFNIGVRNQKLILIF